VATGRGRWIKDIYDLVREHLGLAPNPAVKIVPVGSDDVREVVPDPSSAVETLGWTPKVDFRTMMQRMLEWFDAHGVTEIHSHLVHDRRDGQQVSHAAG
jgi:UDP-glucose 4-epimerase